MADKGRDFCGRSWRGVIEAIETKSSRKEWAKEEGGIKGEQGYEKINESRVEEREGGVRLS